MKYFLAMSLIFLSACSGGGSAGAGAADGVGPGLAVGDKPSASDLRRAIASVTADPKNFSSVESSSRINNGTNQLYWSCDRKSLPRTCCYYFLNGGGRVFGSPSCVEENH